MNMKKTIIFLVMEFMLCVFSYAQTDTIVVLGLTPSDIIAPSTITYNCHAYAWHLIEGNSEKVWIINIDHNLDTYWSSDYGCFEECTESEAEKILYVCGDHSAVPSTVAGKYESK